MAGGTSHNGVSIDVLKSGVQKYIRRGIFEKAIWCALELDMFHELLHAQPTTGLKALSTNILNRQSLSTHCDAGSHRCLYGLENGSFYEQEENECCI